MEYSYLTVLTNNFLHSLCSLCSVALNGVNKTHAIDPYNYVSLSWPYCPLAITPPFRYWQTCSGTWIMVTYCPVTLLSPMQQNKFPSRDGTELNLAKNSNIMTASIVTSLIHVIFSLGVRLQIKFAKVNSNFYIMCKDSVSNSPSNFLDAILLVNRARPIPSILMANNSALSKGAIARWNLTGVELKTFTFTSATKSLSKENIFLGNDSQTPSIHRVKLNGLSLLCKYKLLFFPQLRSQLFCAECERDTDT